MVGRVVCVGLLMIASLAGCLDAQAPTAWQGDEPPSPGGPRGTDRAWFEPNLGQAGDAAFMMRGGDAYFYDDGAAWTVGAEVVRMTFVGGSAEPRAGTANAIEVGGALDDDARDIEYDPTLGAIGITGETASADFFTTAGAYQVVFGGATDTYVSVFDAALSPRWSTYVGGFFEEEANGIHVDATHHWYITGDTDSNALCSALTPCYPQINSAASSNAMNDVFVTALDAAGTPVWSIVYGGRDADSGADVVTPIGAGPAGPVVVIGTTYSAPTGFPPGVFGPGGPRDGFVSVLECPGGVC